MIIVKIIKCLEASIFEFMKVHPPVDWRPISKPRGNTAPLTACSATDQIRFRSFRLDSLTCPLWTGKDGFISSYCSYVSSIITHYTGFLFLVLTDPRNNSAAASSCPSGALKNADAVRNPVPRHNAAFTYCPL